MISKLSKGQFLQIQFRKELMFISQVFFNILPWNSEPQSFKLLAKVVLAEIFEAVNQFILPAVIN